MTSVGSEGAPFAKNPNDTAPWWAIVEFHAAFVKVAVFPDWLTVELHDC